MTDSQDQTFSEMAATTPEHDRLRPFAGTFRAEVKIWFGPEPTLSTGTMTNRLDLGGRFLHQSYKGDPSEGPFPDFEGRGYWGFNKTTGRYEGFWIDNASTMMQNEAGEVDETGKVWTMLGELANPQTGDNMSRRSVITLIDDDHHSMEQFYDTPDGEVKAMEIAYTRVG